MTNKTREAFANHIDSLISSDGGLMQALELDDDGYYKTYWVANRWTTWQAATLVERERCASLVEKSPASMSALQAAIRVGK